MNAPQQFFDEFEPLQERIRWAQAGLGTDKQIVQGKMMLEEFREFFGRWRPQVAGHAEVCRQLDDLFQKLNRMERHLHQVFWAHLNEVIGTRKQWLAAEASLKATVAITVLRREMPEKLRDGFERSFRTIHSTRRAPFAKVKRKSPKRKPNIAGNWPVWKLTGRSGWMRRCGNGWKSWKWRAPMTGRRKSRGKSKNWGTKRRCNGLGKSG